MPALSSRSVKRAATVLGSLLALALAGWAAVRHPDVRAGLRGLAADAVQKQLGLSVSVASVELGMPLKLVGEAIRLSHPEHGLLVSARKLEIEPSLLGLLLGELRIKRVLIEDPRVRLRLIGGEIVNLPALEPSAEPATDRASPLRVLEVRRASVVIDAAPQFRASLQGLDAVAELLEAGRLDLQLQARDGFFEQGMVRERLTALSFEGFVAPGKQIEVVRAQLDSSLLQASAQDATIALPVAKGGRYAGMLRAAMDLEKLQSLPLDVALPQFQGHVAFSAEVQGQGASFHARGDLHADNPVLEGFGFGILDLAFELTPEGLTLLPGSEAQVVQDGGRVLLEGRVGFSEDVPIDIRTDIKRLEFHKLMAQLGVTDDCVVNWVLKGGFRLAGTANPLSLSGPIWADHVSFAALTGAWHDPASEQVIRTPPGHIAGRVVVRPDALRFENLLGRLPHSQVAVTVHVGFEDEIGVRASSKSLDLRDADHLMGMPILGRGAFSLDVGGTYDATTLTGTLDLQDFALDDYRVGHLRSRAIMEKEGLAVRFVDTQVEKNDSRYVVDDLLLDFERAFLIEASARLEKLALADFYHTLRLDTDPSYAAYQGHLTGQADVRFTLGFPGDAPGGTLRVRTDARILDARVYDLLFDGGRLSGEWVWKRIEEGTRGAELTVEQLVLGRGQGTLIASGAMALGGALNFTVFGERLLARQLIPRGAVPVDVRGELGLVGTVRGDLARPQAALELNLLGVRVDGRVLGDGHLRTYLTHRDDPWVQRALEASGAQGGEPCLRARRALARADWGGAQGASGPGSAQAYLVCGSSFQRRLDLDLALGLDPSLPLRGHVVFRDVPAVWLMPKPPVRDAALLGAVSGSIALSGGGLSTPDSLIGRVEVSEFALGLDRAWLRGDGPIQVALTGRGARIERASFVGEGTRIVASGGGSMARGLAARVAGRLDLRVFKSFVPSVLESSGSLSVDVKLSGDPRNPSVFGRARVREGMLLLSQLRRPLDKIEASISFSEHELLLEELGATLAGGRLSVHGSAAISAEALGRYELFLEARDVSLSPMDGVDVAFGADAKLTGGPSMRIPRLSGTVRLARAVYKRPFTLGIAERLGGFSQAKRVVRETYDPKDDRVEFDLRVIEDAPLKVANNLLTAELSIEDSERPFRVVGTDQRTGLLGTLELKRGTLVFRNTQFLIEQGTVSFNDATKIRPRLDVSARTDFRRTADASGAHWLISLHAFGEADDLKLETSSEPALAREDIALLLTVGLTRAEAERLGTTQLTQGAALEALASVTGLDREVKKALPVIDDFAVTSAYSARTNRTEPQVVVGKRLSDRVRATATTGLSAESNFKTGVQWRLNNQTSLEAGYDNVQTTTSSQFGNVGVDLRWRLEFD